MGTMRVARNFTMSPLEAKAYRILLTANFCKYAGFRALILATNLLHAINIVKSNTLFLQDAKNILNSFSSWTACYTPRNSNAVAHILAKVALTLMEDMYEFETIPECISNTIDKDCMSVIWQFEWMTKFISKEKKWVFHFSISSYLEM